MIPELVEIFSLRNSTDIKELYSEKGKGLELVIPSPFVCTAPI